MQEQQATCNLEIWSFGDKDLVDFIKVELMFARPRSHDAMFTVKISLLTPAANAIISYEVRRGEAVPSMDCGHPLLSIRQNHSQRQVLIDGFFLLVHG